MFTELYEEHSRIVLRTKSTTPTASLKTELNYSANTPTKSIESFYTKIIEQVDLEQKQCTDPKKLSPDSRSSSFSKENDRSEYLTHSESNETIFPTDASEYLTYAPRRRTTTESNESSTSSLSNTTSSEKSYKRRFLRRKNQVEVQASTTRSNKSKPSQSLRVTSKSEATISPVNGAGTDNDKQLLPENKFHQTNNAASQTDITSPTDPRISTAKIISKESDTRNVNRTEQSEHISSKLSRANTACHLVLGYKSIDGRVDSGLLNNWLKWSGAWDAFMMLQEELLTVEHIAM